MSVTYTLLDIVPEFQVNTETYSDQDAPNVSSLPNGGFIITWVSRYQDGDGRGVYAQLYNSDGAAQGSEFQVNTETGLDQYQPVVNVLPDGDFVIFWSSNFQDGSSLGVFGQRFSSDAVPLGTEFQVNTETLFSQSNSDVTGLAGGGYVVTWASYEQDGSGHGVYGQMFAADGSPVGSEFQINTETHSTQNQPSIAALGDGGFVVTWQSNGQDGDLYGVFAQRYASDGTTVGSEFQVNTTVINHQNNPAIAPLADGGFVVTWSSVGQDGSGSGIVGQRYSDDGTPPEVNFW